MANVNKTDYTEYWKQCLKGDFDGNDKKQRVTSLSTLCKKIDNNYNEERSAWYEYTQTLSPKKFYKENKKKVLYCELEPKKQMSKLIKSLKGFIDGVDITGIICFEFNKNGNIHFHSLLRHTGGYEVTLRQLQQKMKSKFGRNSLSKVNNLEKYGGYIFKSLEDTHIRPYQVNPHIIDKCVSRENITYFMEYDSDEDTD